MGGTVNFPLSKNIEDMWEIVTFLLSPFSFFCIAKHMSSLCFRVSKILFLKKRWMKRKHIPNFFLFFCSIPLRCSALLYWDGHRCLYLQSKWKTYSCMFNNKNINLWTPISGFKRFRITKLFFGYNLFGQSFDMIRV